MSEFPVFEMTELDGDIVRVKGWHLRDSAVATVLTTGRDGRRTFSRLDRAKAVELISALTDVVQERDEREAAEAAAVQLRADVEAAKALEIGTRVRISKTPAWDRDGGAVLYGDRVAGKVGTVHAKIDGSDGVAPFGVHAGRVVVSVPGVVTGQGRDTVDLHVSCLTVEPLPEAPKLKAGDVVYFRARPRWRRVVISDVDENGCVDLVNLTGNQPESIQYGARASLYAKETA